MSGKKKKKPTTDPRYKSVLAVMTALEDRGFQARMAGGCVRDRLLGLQPKDYDVATTARPDDVSKIFRALGQTVAPTGIEHGTVTVVTPTGPVEVTTLRKDVATDGRHAVVDFDGATFESDASRRDFTINAMFEDRHGQVFDFFDGRKHLAEKRLAFVGLPQKRIKEDYLRILRFFRFWARFSLTPDPAALPAIAAERDGLARVSQERITSELLQFLTADSILAPLKALDETKVLSLILPERAPIEIPDALLISLGDLAPEARPLARLAALFWRPDGSTALSSESAMGLAIRLKFSTRHTRTLTYCFSGYDRLGNFSTGRAAAMDFLDHAEEEGGKDSFPTLYLPFWIRALSKNCAASQALDYIARVDLEFDALRRTPLPISGHDLCRELALKAGPEVGRLLRQLREEFRNGRWVAFQEGIARAKELFSP